MSGNVITWCVWIIVLYTFMTGTTPVSSENASVTTAALTPSPSLCPTFPVKQENKTLTFTLLPNKCELVVRVRVVMRTTKTTRSLSFLKGRRLKPLARNLHLTEVEMIPIETTNPVAGGDNMTTEAPATCPDYRIRNIGLLTVIDTVRNVCQLVVGVQRISVDTPSTNRRDRYDFVPVFQYLEEAVFR